MSWKTNAPVLHHAGIDREIASLQLEEKKLVAEIKKTAATGNKVSDLDVRCPTACFDQWSSITETIKRMRSKESPTFAATLCSRREFSFCFEVQVNTRGSEIQ